MKINVDRDELVQVESLLPESARELIAVLGYSAASRLISRFGGITLSRKTGEGKEQTGGVHRLLHDVMTEDEVRQLLDHIGSDAFYIPRCDVALRALRNLRFLTALAEQQQAGLSLRQAMALLCPQFDISDRQGWKLVSERSSRSGIPTQSGLFEE